MDLSKKERLTLLNQYLILQALQPDQSWGEFAEIVQSGYERQYFRLAEHIYDPLTADDCRFVERVLAMFDALQRPYVEAGKDVPGDIKFLGFDGNNEGHMLSYARFLIEKQGRWVYLQTMHVGDLNSHMPTIDRYSRMLVAWEAAGEPHMLTSEDARRVMQA